MSSRPVARVSEDEYLRMERAAAAKSEFVGGEVLAMAGGSTRHGLLVGNWVSELKSKLAGKCFVFPSDLKVRAVTGDYVYPDVSVVCGDPVLHGTADDILTNPTLIVEVLSISTAPYDRGRKFEMYRTIPSLQDYIMSHTNSAHVEHFQRQPDGGWLFREYRGMESPFQIPSLGCTVRLAELYADVLKVKSNLEGA